MRKDKAKELEKGVKRMIMKQITQGVKEWKKGKEEKQWIRNVEKIRKDKIDVGKERKKGKRNKE